MRWLSLLSVGVALSGCTIRFGGSSEENGSEGRSCAGIAGDCGTACSDILAASKIGFSSDRAEVLKVIAGRSNLSTHEQIRLVNATVTPGGFSRDQADVLVALASNPCLAPEARQHLATRLDALFHSFDCKRVVDALNANVDPGKRP